jgi:pimeloyl-ACP methyl ester carboxylesterase
MRRGVGQAVAIAMIALVSTACASAQSVPVISQSRFVAEGRGDRLVVFVHGIGGDAGATWRNPATNVWWPELLATDPAMAGFDVYVADYFSPLLTRASTIEEIAQRMLQQFRDRGFFTRYAQVHFVTHSMGGLVTKRMLNELHRPADQETLRRVRTVLFLSTPAQGAEIAELASWLSANPQLADMKPADLNAFLQALENDWQTLLRDRDTAGAVFPRTYCAYETRPTATVMIVSRVYASTRCDATPYAIDADHGRIVKPADRDDDPYPWARARLLETAALTAPASPARAFRLTLQIHEVAHDDKGRLLVSRTFTGDAPRTDETVTAAATWIVGELGQRFDLARPAATVRLRVPADPGRDRIEIETVPRAAVSLWIVEPRRKLRLPFDPSAVASLGRDFDLEIAIPGYGTQVRRIVWGRSTDESFTIPPTPLQVGIEKIEGDSSLAVRLADALAGERRVVLKPPASLARLRQEIADSRAALARDPGMQMALRTSLGLDVLISGTREPR